MSGKDVPRAFPWVAAAGEVLTPAAGEETDGTKLDIAYCITVSESKLFYSLWMAVGENSQQKFQG